MSYEPPIPEAARSPYPLQLPPISETGSAQAASPPSVAGSEAKTPEGEDSLATRARETFDRVKESRYGLGAAIGIGSAALLAAVLFARRGKTEQPPVAVAARVRRKPGAETAAKS